MILGLPAVCFIMAAFHRNMILKICLNGEPLIFKRQSRTKFFLKNRITRLCFSNRRFIARAVCAAKLRIEQAVVLSEL